ncbi:hypothetical protein ECZU03_17790 [Escherichia coli]|nr:hypothetical protein ECZU03_17790 [Escherichia coli]
MAATRVSLGSVMACLLLVLTLGLVIGGSAGLIGGRVDQATMRVADMFMTFRRRFCRSLWSAYSAPG